MTDLKIQVCKTMGLQSSDWYISGHMRHQSNLDAGCPNIQVNLSVRGKGGGYDHDTKPIDLITFDRATPTAFIAEEHATVPATMVEQARNILSVAAIITTHSLEAIDNLHNCLVNATDSASIDNAFSAIREFRRNRIKASWESCTIQDIHWPSAECYICSGQFEKRQQVVRYGCQHMAHKECHEQWTESVQTTGQAMVHKCTLCKQVSSTLENLTTIEESGADETGTLLCISISGAGAQAIVAQARKQRIHTRIVFISAIQLDTTTLVDAASITTTALTTRGPRAVHDATDIGPIGATFLSKTNGTKTPQQLILLGMTVDVDVTLGKNSTPTRMSIHGRWCRSATLRIMAQSHAEQDAIDIISPVVLKTKQISWQTSIIKGSALAEDMKKGTESLCIHTLSCYGANAEAQAEELANAIMAESTSRLTPGSGIWILPHSKLAYIVAIHVNSRGPPLIVETFANISTDPA